MVQIYMPGWYFPGCKILKGYIGDWWIVGIHVIVPAWEITLWNGFTVWNRFLIFDSDWLWVPISSFLSNLWSWIYAEINNAWSGIENYLTEVWGYIYAELYKVWGGIENYLTEIWGYIYREIHNAWSGITDFINDTWAAEYREIHRFWDAVVAQADTNKNTLYNTITSIPRIATETVIGWINSAFLGIVQMLLKSLDEMVAQYYREHSEEK